MHVKRLLIFFEGRAEEYPFDPAVIDAQINNPSSSESGGVYLGATGDYLALLAYAGREFGISAVRLDKLIEYRVCAWLSGDE